MDHMQAIKDIAGIDRFFHFRIIRIVSLDIGSIPFHGLVEIQEPIAIRRIDDTPWSSIVFIKI